MKQYKIYALESYGIFYCIEKLNKETNEINLVGRFNKTGVTLTFIKQDKDIELN